MVHHAHVEQTRPERALAMQEAARELGSFTVEIIAQEGEDFGHKSGALVGPGMLGVRVEGEVPLEKGTWALYTLTNEILEQRGQGRASRDDFYPVKSTESGVSEPIRKRSQSPRVSKPKVVTPDKPKPKKKEKPAPSDPIAEEKFTDHMSRITRRILG